MTRFLLDWQVGSDTGWGVFGLYLALCSVRRGGPMPILVAEPAVARMDPLHARVLAGVLDASRTFRSSVARFPDRRLRVGQTLIQALGNGMRGTDTASAILPARRVAMVFFEDSHLDPASLRRAAQFDRIIAGSSWNARLLRGYGLTDVDVCLQGVDPALFHPAPRSGWFPGRFVVFSGGKLEYRKGQDIVVAAFREFHRRHSDALLMVAWHNPWPSTMAEIPLAGHVEGVPALGDDRRLDVVGWLARNGIPGSAVLDLGPVPHAQLGAMLREADVAVFPNRAEGGTNLVAMECMASGVPTVLAANTGHLDLIDGDNCLTLTAQSQVPASSRYRGTEGWGESSVAEVVDALEFAYSEREEAARYGLRGSESLRQHTWDRRIGAFLEAIDDLLAPR